jgi:hypothetical protein
MPPRPEQIRRPEAGNDLHSMKESLAYSKSCWPTLNSPFQWPQSKPPLPQAGPPSPSFPLWWSHPTCFSPTRTTSRTLPWCHYRQQRHLSRLVAPPSCDVPARSARARSASRRMSGWRRAGRKEALSAKTRSPQPALMWAHGLPCFLSLFLVMFMLGGDEMGKIHDPRGGIGGIRRVSRGRMRERMEVGWENPTLYRGVKSWDIELHHLLPASVIAPTFFYINNGIMCFGLQVRVNPSVCRQCHWPSINSGRRHSLGGKLRKLLTLFTLPCYKPMFTYVLRTLDPMNEHAFRSTHRAMVVPGPATETLIEKGEKPCLWPPAVPPTLIYL